MAASPATKSQPAKTLTQIQAVRAAAPVVELSLHEHRADGSVEPLTVTMPPTALTYRADGSVEKVTLFLPICSYCASRMTGVRVQPKPKKPNKVVRFGKWLLGVK